MSLQLQSPCLTRYLTTSIHSENISIHFQEFNVSDIKIHPNFNNATLVNDIALLRLERPAKRQQVGF